jgi:hypothetical protein
MECPRFGGHLSAWSAVSGVAGRIVCHAKGIELQEAVPAGAAQAQVDAGKRAVLVGSTSTWAMRASGWAVSGWSG